MSKNNLRGINLVRGPIWGSHCCKLIEWKCIHFQSGFKGNFNISLCSASNEAVVCCFTDDWLSSELDLFLGILEPSLSAHSFMNSRIYFVLHSISWVFLSGIMVLITNFPCTYFTCLADCEFCVTCVEYTPKMRAAKFDCDHATGCGRVKVCFYHKNFFFSL